MVICSGCDRCFHLRCLIPPRTTAPDGDWYCPGCDPLFTNLAEMHDPTTVLLARQGDPYRSPALLAYVRAGNVTAALPLEASERRQLIKEGNHLRAHPTLPDWLMFYKRLRSDHFRWVVLPPPGCRWNVIRLMHEQLGHCGINQTCRQLGQHFFWTGIREDVSAFVACCDACQRRKFLLPDPPPAMHEPIRYGPFRQVHIDLAGPFTAPVVDVHGQIVPWPTRPQRSMQDDAACARKVQAWIVLMIDYNTKVAELDVIYEKEALHTARSFYNCWVTRYGAPACVTSDNGAEFQGIFHHSCYRMGIEHIYITPGHPAANGAVERLVRSIKSMLAAHVNNQPEHWIQSLPHVRGAYMARLHEAFGVSPNQMLMGCNPRPPLPVCEVALAERLAAQAHITRLAQTLTVFEDEALASIRQQFAANLSALQQRAVRDARAVRPIRPGDWVLEILEGPVPALASQVAGPFEVVEVKGTTVVLATDATQFRERRTFVRALDRVVRYLRKSDVLRDALAPSGN